MIIIIIIIIIIMIIIIINVRFPKLCLRGQRHSTPRRLWHCEGNKFVSSEKRK